MFLATFGILLALVLTYFIYAAFVKPYRRNLWYVKTYGKRCIGIYYPILGNVKFVRESFRKFGDSLKWIRDLVSTNEDVQFLIGYSNIHIVDADLAKDITLKHIGSVRKSGMLEFREFLFEQGIIFSEGETWKKQRGILAHSFSYDVLKSRIPKINETVRMMIAQIDTLKGKEPVKISQECQKITAEVVLRSFFGDRFSEQRHQGENLGLYLTNLLLDVFGQTRRLRTLLPKLLLPQFTHKFFYDNEHAAVKQRVLGFRQLIVNEVDLRIADYNAEKANKDFLDILVDEYVANRKANGGSTNDAYITKESIVHQFLVFFFAGMDTTGNLSGIMIYWLAKRKDVLDRVEKEVNEVFGSDTKELTITDESLKKLSYCHMFIHEALRYHCPAMLLFPRKAAEDFKIGGDILVQKGMDINISLHGILRREKYFENADDFEPLRFSDENKRKMNHLAFIPFSSGPKNCIGQHMAIIEAKIILVHFVRNFKITLNEHVPLRMDSNSLYAPADDRLVFLQRKSF